MPFQNGVSLVYHSRIRSQLCFFFPRSNAHLGFLGLIFKLFALHPFILTVHFFFAADQGLFCLSGGFVQQSYCFYSKSWHKHVQAYSWFSWIRPQRSGYKYLISGRVVHGFSFYNCFFLVYFFKKNKKQETKHFIELMERDHG